MRKCLETIVGLFLLCAASGDRIKAQELEKDAVQSVSAGAVEQVAAQRSVYVVKSKYYTTNRFTNYQVEGYVFNRTGSEIHIGATIEGNTVLLIQDNKTINVVIVDCESGEVVSLTDQNNYDQLTNIFQYTPQARKRPHGQMSLEQDVFDNSMQDVANVLGLEETIVLSKGAENIFAETDFDEFNNLLDRGRALTGGKKWLCIAYNDPFQWSILNRIIKNRSHYDGDPGSSRELNQNTPLPLCCIRVDGKIRTAQKRSEGYCMAMSVYSDGQCFNGNGLAYKMLLQNGSTGESLSITSYPGLKACFYYPCNSKTIIIEQGKTSLHCEGTNDSFFINEAVKFAQRLESKVIPFLKQYVDISSKQKEEQKGK